MSIEHKLQLTDLLSLAERSRAVDQPCTCSIDAYRGWTRVPADFPESQMRVVGTLVEDPYGDPTFAEYHPHGTEYWSALAPVALRHFPYNRCSVLQCSVCGRACLKHIEAGGYYVEPRIRALDPTLIVDIALDE